MRATCASRARLLEIKDTGLSRVRAHEMADGARSRITGPLGWQPRSQAGFGKPFLHLNIPNKNLLILPIGLLNLAPADLSSRENHITELLQKIHIRLVFSYEQYSRALARAYVCSHFKNGLFLSSIFSNFSKSTF